MKIRHAMFGDIGEAALAGIKKGPSAGGCTLRAVIEGVGMSVELEIGDDEALRLYNGLEPFAEAKQKKDEAEAKAKAKAKAADKP